MTFAKVHVALHSCCGPKMTELEEKRQQRNMPHRHAREGTLTARCLAEGLWNPTNLANAIADLGFRVGLGPIAGSGQWP